MLGSGGPGLDGLRKPAVLSVNGVGISWELGRGKGPTKNSTEVLKSGVNKGLSQCCGLMGQSNNNLFSGPTEGPNILKNNMMAEL